MSSLDNIVIPEGFLVEEFFEEFYRQTGWNCIPGTTIYKLRKFALQHLLSSEPILSLVLRFILCRIKLWKTNEDIVTYSKNKSQFIYSLTYDD